MESTTGAVKPSRTLMGMPAPRELVDKMRRHRVQKRLDVLIAAAKEAPNAKGEQKDVNEAIKWLGKNLAIMDDAEKADALYVLKIVARFGAMYVDPVEAGYAMMSVGAEEAERITFGLTMARALNNGIKTTMSERIPLYYTLLAATLGDEKSIRMVLFWADMAKEAAPESHVSQIYGEVPQKAARIAFSYPEIVNKLYEERARILMETPSYEEIIAGLKEKKNEKAA